MKGDWWRELSGGVALPTPMRLAAAAVGLAAVVLPATAAPNGARLLVPAGVVLSLATVFIAAHGLPTLVGAVAIVETTFAVVHQGGVALPVCEALLLLTYLLVADQSASRRGEAHVDKPVLISDTASAFAGALLLIAVVLAVAFVRVSGSFVVEILGGAAAVGGVALLWSALGSD